MLALYDSKAPKKATNLSLNSDLLKKTRALNINLSATLEQALKDKLKSIEAKKWVTENKNAIKAYNDFVDENGCFDFCLYGFSLLKETFLSPSPDALYVKYIHSDFRFYRKFCKD